MTLAIDLLGSWLGRERIEQLLPHRPPFLFLHKARLRTAREAEGRVRWQQVIGELYRVRGGRVVVPTALLLEAAAQLAGIVIASHAPAACPCTLAAGLLAGVRKARVHRSVASDRAFRLAAYLRPMGNGLHLAAAQAWSDRTLALTCELVISVPRRAALVEPDNPGQR